MSPGDPRQLDGRTMAAGERQQGTVGALPRICANGFCDGESCTHGATRAAEIALSREWLREFASPTKTIRARCGRSSYALKHAVERWTRQLHSQWRQIDRADREWTGNYHYVSNGAFIVAAIAEGYRVKRISDGPNAFFNLTCSAAARKAAV